MTRVPSRHSGIHALSHSHNFADHFVAEDRGRLDHLGVITALPDLQVRAVGQRQAHTQQHFIHGQRGHINLFDAKIFAAVEHGGRHARRNHDFRLEHCFFQSDFRFLWGRGFHSCVIKIFSELSVG